MSKELEGIRDSVVDLENHLVEAGARVQFDDAIASERFSKVLTLIKSIRRDVESATFASSDLLDVIESKVANLPQAFDYVLLGALSDADYDICKRLLDLVSGNLNLLRFSPGNLPRR